MAADTPKSFDSARSETKPEPATSLLELSDTEIGSVFVSNYPPFSTWNEDGIEELRLAFGTPGGSGPIGMYLHLPFCRKRCKFCYFRVYTDKNASQIQSYLEACGDELETLASFPGLGQRTLDFLYFGGGTPSFLSPEQLETLFETVRAHWPWAETREIAFECEPGTLQPGKVQCLKEQGITRLSLGIEHFNDEILATNGRAHVSKEIYRCLPWIQEADFAQFNIDLIAGMLGDSWDLWKDTVRQTIDISPDSVTIYQMELPFNTDFSKQHAGGTLESPLANWETKRAWHAYAVDEMEKAGYRVSSAYTMVKDASTEFIYRDALWHGADMLACGVSSFGHFGGVHFQNQANWDRYLTEARAGNLAVARAFVTSPEDRLRRECLLQLKLGRIQTKYFQDKFDVDIIEYFAPELELLESKKLLTIHANGRRENEAATPKHGDGLDNTNDAEIRLTRDGLLRVDTFLPLFYENKYRDKRYT